MKRLVISAALVVLLGFAGLANADLINNGGGLVYDTVLDVTFYAPTPTAMNWNQSVAWASSLDIWGTTAGSWSLPTTPAISSGSNFTGGQMGELYFELGQGSNVGPVTNLLLNQGYWTATEYTPGYAAFLYGFFNGGYQGASVELGTPYYAMAVHAGNIVDPPRGDDGGNTNVPEPTTMLLLGLGLIGLAGVRRKFKN